MQLQQNNLVTCETCSNRVLIKEMKFDLTGTSLICPECHEKQKSRTTAAFAGEQLGQSLAIERWMERANRTEQYIFYKCESCAFSFSRKTDFTFKNCPNCGNHNIKITQGNTAQKVIDESGKDTDLGIDFL